MKLVDRGIDPLVGLMNDPLDRSTGMTWTRTDDGGERDRATMRLRDQRSWAVGGLDDSQGR